jgi:hypothetical protein
MAPTSTAYVDGFRQHRSGTLEELGCDEVIEHLKLQSAVGKMAAGHSATLNVKPNGTIS